MTFERLLHESSLVSSMNVYAKINYPKSYYLEYLNQNINS